MRNYGRHDVYGSKTLLVKIKLQILYSAYRPSEVETVDSSQPLLLNDPCPPLFIRP